MGVCRIHMSETWLLDVGWDQDQQGMEWEAASTAGKAKLNLTPALLLSSRMTLGKSLKFSELQGAHGSNEGKHSPLPEDLHRPPRKIFGTE